MADVCLHENKRAVGDMPLADPDTLEFLGRFDVTFCVDCETVLEKVPTSYPEAPLMVDTPMQEPLPGV